MFDSLLISNIKLAILNMHQYVQSRAVVLPGDMDAAKRLQEANLHHSQQAECYDFGKEKIIAVSWTFDCNSRDHDIIGASV